MSITEACLELAPRKPPPTPLELARAHQRAIRDNHEKATADASCVRQIMAGRYVRSRVDDKLYLVTEVRLAASWVVQLYGRSKGQKGRRAASLIGTLDSVGIINVGGDQ